MKDLPVIVIGAGPIGLAAAANLVTRGILVKVFETGDAAGANIRDWGHVRLFSPWEFNVDPACRTLLEAAGWQEPEAGSYPTGNELVETYLAPLAATNELASVIDYGVRVAAISRHGIDKVVSRDRELRPFQVTVVGRDGAVSRAQARAVIDASGTWTTPNPVSASGVRADGEETLADRIAYGIPDVLGRDRADYVGRRTLVVGAGIPPRTCCSISMNSRLGTARPRRSGSPAAGISPVSTAAARTTNSPRGETSGSASAASSRKAASSWSPASPLRVFARMGTALS